MDTATSNRAADKWRPVYSPSDSPSRRSFKWLVTRRFGKEWLGTPTGKPKRFPSEQAAQRAADQANTREEPEPRAESPTRVAGRVGKVELRVPVDSDLAQSLDEFLAGRGITLADAVGLYLRSMVNSFDRGKALRLSSKMPFGKYRGEPVETIVRADPGYMRFLLSGDRPIMLEPEVQALL